MIDTQLKPWIQGVKRLIDASHVVLPNNSIMRLYHHKGLRLGMQVGAAFINVIQHDYCKFIVCMLPEQEYPIHFHRIKDESFFLLYGDLSVVIEEDVHTLARGDIVNVPRRFNHSFTTKKGCVFEEISTAYLQNDSVYEDESIRKMAVSEKVTELPISVLYQEVSV
jgi:N-acetylneuraminate synthase